MGYSTPRKSPERITASLGQSARFTNIGYIYITLRADRLGQNGLCCQGWGWYDPVPVPQILFLFPTDTIYSRGGAIHTLYIDYSQNYIFRHSLSAAVDRPVPVPSNGVACCVMVMSIQLTIATRRNYATL